jgi:hypothetical protein
MASSSPEKKNNLLEKENGKIEGEEISEKAMTKLDKIILIKKRTLLSLRVLYLEKPKISSI